MRYLVFTFILFCISIPTFSQHLQKNDTSFVCGERIEKEAEMDEKYWRNYLSKNLDLSSLTTDTIPPGIYKITFQFVIDTMGRITVVKIIKDPGYRLGTKVVEVISAYDGKCIPAELNGRKIKAYRKQEITFTVEKEE